MGPFCFKQFSLNHERFAMPVNTDGVLLGAWAGLYGADASLRILDVGTGCGIVALMMAQRFPEATIDALDIDLPSVEEAAENAVSSPWSSRIAVYCSDFRNFEAEHPYDLIVSNPPFFLDSLKTPDARRTNARHSHSGSLPHGALLRRAAALLGSSGQFAVILPADQAESFLEMAALAKPFPLYLNRRTNVYSHKGKPAFRVLLSLGRAKEKQGEDALFIYNETGAEYNPVYIQLVKDFYLWA